MTFKPGDKVKFLNDVGGGVVKKVQNKIAYVETSDGFEIPSSFSELILVEEANPLQNQTLRQFSKPEPKSFSAQEEETNREYQKLLEKKTSVMEEEEEAEELADTTDDENIITNENCTLNIILGIVPVRTKKSAEPEFRIYMISDCAYRMFYTLSVIKENFVYGHSAGLVEEDSKTLITTFTVSDLRELQSFKINCIFFKTGIYLPHEPLVHEYKIDVFQLSDPANWQENDYFDEKAIIVNLTEESLLYEIERMVSETEEKYIIQKKKKDVKAKSASQSQHADMEEVDLHVEQLVDDFSGMSAGEILDLQMSRFTIALDGAVRNKTRKIVFIHGIGNGKLKYEIRKTLDSKYSRLKYQDASFKEYGYGATMVILK
ncbi:MAG TPA: DUF2027 domain-containing protein [Bacteroidales bacterium]|nr:DUF2027 domain-containing protein [Bacteroidales bacterium]